MPPSSQLSFHCMRTELNYRREIDGLRAFAVVAVVLFHLGCGWLPGGFLGVDVFFVISGLLIGRILLRNIHAGSFSFAEFITRRVLRILPAMLAMIVVTLATSWFFVFRPEQAEIGRVSLAALLSVANFYFWWTAGNYWAPAAEQSPLLHTWSLSVEEQFYLVAPLSFWVVHRVAPKLLRPFILTVTIASFGLFVAGLATNRFGETFFLLPARAWELGTGCCLAAFLASDDGQRTAVSWLRGAAGIVGIVLIGAAYLLAPGIGPRMNWTACLAVAGTALVLAFAQSGPSHWLLTKQPLTWLGKSSYSIYLWHWPVIVLAEQLGWSSRKWLLCIPILLLAALSYYFVEQPCRRNRRFLPMIFGSYVVALSLAFFMARTMRTYDTSAFEKPPLSFGYYSICGPQKLRDASARRFWNVISAGYESLDRVRPDNEYLQGGLILGSGGTPKVVVLGDSQGAMWSPVIHAVTERRGITTSFQAAGGDQPFIDLPADRRCPSSSFDSEQKVAFDKARMDWIARWKPDLVIIGSRWSDYFESDVHPLLAFLESHTKHVLLVDQPPDLVLGNGRSALQWICYQGAQPQDGVKLDLPTHNAKNHERSQAMLETLAKRYRNVTIVPTYDLYARGTNNQRVLVLDGKHMVYIDSYHLTDYGAGLAERRFDEIIGNIFPQKPSRPSE